MPENIGSGSAPYNTQIPLLAENADIQTAFRLYHYGSDTNTPSSPLPENSVARHLQDLEDFKISKTPANLANLVDLNTKTETGFYIQESNSFAAGGSNYPSPYSGLLTVISNVSEGTVFQQYQVIGATESGSANTLNRTWWRSYFSGSWKAWRTFVESSDFAAIGDDRYYTKTLANGLFYSQTYINGTFLTQADANLRLYLQESVQTGSYTLALSDLNKVVAMNNSSTANLTIPNNTSVAFPIGSVINVYRMTDQNVTIVPADETVVIRNSGVIYQQYTEISLRKRAINEWVASGNIIPA
jgi:hypothetical protein